MRTFANSVPNMAESTIRNRPPHPPTVSEPIPVLTLVTRARRALALNFPAPVWVRGELTQLNERRGNRYLQLTQKGDTPGSVLARADGHVWASDYARVVRSRGAVAAQVLELGREVSVQVEVDFHEVYGFRLRVVDWDPAFTLGQLEVERRAVLERLTREGLLDRNRARALAPVVQRLAVITSAAAAGYADFREQLRGNAYGYAFAVTHLDVAVQGPDTEPAVVAALSRVGTTASRYDCVCIVRGGGGRLDLASFDRYGIGAAIADCPLPVFVGIGHETDETVPDAVAYRSLKTPTAVAEALVAHNAAYESALVHTGRRVGRFAQQRTVAQRHVNQRLEAQIRGAAALRVASAGARLDGHIDRLPRLTVQAFAKTHLELDALTRQLDALDPARVLERGYTLTTDGDGRRARPAALRSGDELQTYFADGQKVESRVV